MIQPMNVRPFGRLDPTGIPDSSPKLRMGALDSQRGEYRVTHYTLLARIEGWTANPQKSAILQHMAIYIPALKAVRVALPVYRRPVETPYFNDLEYMACLTSSPGGMS